MTTGSRHKGRFLSDEDLRKREEDKQRKALEAGRRKRIAASRRKRKTEREFLLAIAGEITPTQVKKIAKKQVELALKGDKDALAFLGKYCFGGGKVSLADLIRPPVVR